MSAFLGPIHLWLNNQIKIVENREREIINQFSKKYSNTEVHNLISPYRQKYGELKENKPLADLISGNDIHSWLESAISDAQSREAAILAALIEKYDDQELMYDIFSDQAEKLAEKAKKRDDVEEFKLEDAFDIINEHFVERMPCDRLSGVIKEENRIIWKHKSQLHQEFWQETDVDLELMHKLYAKWLSVFINSLNNSISHKREIEKEYYNDIFFIEN